MVDVLEEGTPKDKERQNGRKIKWLDILFGAFAIFVFSSSYTLAKIVLEQVPPITVGAIRFALASAFVLPFALIKYRSRLFGGYSRKDWTIVVAVATSFIFLPQVFQNVGLLYTSASLAGVIQSTIPIFVAILAFLFLKERISSIRWIGAAISLVGVILISSGGNILGFEGSSALGNALQVGATFFYAIGSILVKSALKRMKPAVLITMIFLIGGCLLSLTSISEAGSWPSSLSNETLLALLLFSGLYASGLFCWFWVLEHVSVSSLYFTLFLMPILGIIIPVILLGETFTMLDVTFAFVILLGLGVAQISDIRKESTPKMQ
jgi:drug/metabolite transporter (DMT)-like permease